MLQKFTIFQPNGWDNSILPIDIIHKLINEMNTVIDYINSMEDHSVERAKEYTDSQIALVNDEITITNNNLSSLNQSLHADIRTLSYSLNVLTERLNSDEQTLRDTINTEAAHYSELRSGLAQVYRDMHSMATQLRNYADLKDIVLREQLEAEINELRVVIDNILNIETIDGFTGSKKTVREIIGTKIIMQTKLKGANRYALSWGQLSTTYKTGWLAKYSSRVTSRINYMAPTWHNFMINNYDFGAASALYSVNMNTWGALANLTLLFIGDIVHKINFYCTSGTAAIAANYKTVDVFKKSEWDTYISSGTPVPDVERVDVTENYDGTNSHVSLILSQFKLSMATFTGAVGGYGLYASSGTNSLFSGTSDLAPLFQFLQGNMNLPYWADMYYKEV